MSLTSLLRRRLLLGAALVLFTGFGVPPDDYFEIAKNVDVFTRVVREVHQEYVDAIEPNRFVQTGLEAMLASLDPYTNYIPASDIEEYRFLNTGQYGGVGVRSRIRGSRVEITEVLEEGPARRAGLQVGDYVLSIDGQAVPTPQMQEENVALLFRGQSDRPARLEVHRPGIAQPMTLQVPREEIRVRNVDYKQLLPGGVGYVSLSGFTRGAAAEVKDALQQLSTQYGGPLKGMVLDVRDNPGGLLDEAVGVSNLFLPQGELIVQIRGRGAGSTQPFLAQQTPHDTRTPLVVLVNGRSASASEIVAGSVQDLDRGVILGRRSFGKGLVQTTRPLSYNAQIKITTARYYTPSGRCIQELEYTHTGGAESVRKATDDLQQDYRTRSGRPVRAAGGISPDVPQPERPFHAITRALQDSNHLFDFATQYRQRHPEAGAAPDFKVTDALWAEFTQFLAKRGFRHTGPATAALAQLTKALADEGYQASTSAQVAALRQALEAQLAQDLQRHRTEISEALGAELVGRYHYRGGQLAFTLRQDPDLQQALALLADPARYTALLKP